MAAVSKRAVAVCVAFYARVLQSEVRERLLEGAFISRCVQNRIVEPAWNWYGTDVFAVANAVSVLMKPLTELSREHELDVRRIEELVSTDLFAPKVGLMDSFIQKINDLHRVLNEADELTSDT